MKIDKENKQKRVLLLVVKQPEYDKHKCRYSDIYISYIEYRKINQAKIKRKLHYE